MTSSAAIVREAAVGELARVSATLADAFATEPITQWLIPGRWRRDTRLRRVFAVELAHYMFPAGRVLTTDDFRGASLDRCDQDGVPAYLEASTERSAALYERLGFVHLGELRVPGGPRFWPMRRPPAAAKRARLGVSVRREQEGHTRPSRALPASLRARRVLRL